VALTTEDAKGTEARRGLSCQLSAVSLQPEAGTQGAVRGPCGSGAGGRGRESTTVKCAGLRKHAGSDHMRNFLRERMELVRGLMSGKLPVAYADLALITCAVMSACAARRWPGKGIDRRRFIELLVVHSAPDFHTSWVSVPMLLNRRLIAEENTPYARGKQTRIFRDEEIDLSFDAAAARYPNVPPSVLVDCCCASLIYDQLRCGYAHDYSAGKDMTHVQPSRREARVSYILRGTGPGWAAVRRMATFHLPYLIELAEYHVALVPDEACERPARWWIDCARRRGIPLRPPPGEGC
jgi:hypothetical protein